MARTQTEHLPYTLIQAHFPTLPLRQRWALAHWVLGALLAGSANSPAIVSALATAGIARATTLADAWDACVSAPAHHTTDPPVTGAPTVISPLACGADLLRWFVKMWTGGPLAPGPDATYRCGEMVRMSLLYRGSAIPVSWVVVPANQPGAWEPHWEWMLRWVASALPSTRRAGACGSGIVKHAAVERDPQLWVPSHYAPAGNRNLRANRSATPTGPAAGAGARSRLDRRRGGPQASPQAYPWHAGRLLRSGVRRTVGRADQSAASGGGCRLVCAAQVG